MKILLPFLTGVLCSVMLSAQTIPCNSWLKTTNPADVFTSNTPVSVTGNHLTVEAVFNRTDASNFGFLVSKHTGPGNVNYALYPHGCTISTVNGDFQIAESCPTLINKTYHVAMVYDGVTLKFYRNGFLQSQIAATGNLITNALATTVAQSSAALFPFIGYINEVRIWNVARTKAQIQSFMYSLLPSPTTQTGLLAYYTFTNGTNKQGNTAFNGTLGGGALFAQTNPNCTFVADSCCTANTTTNTSKCNNQSITLTARAGTTYSWSPATGLSATNVQSPVCSATSTISYTVTVFNSATGCTNNDVFNVTVNAAPISHMNDTTICNGDTAQLTAGLGTTYSWTPNFNINSTSIRNPKVWPDVTTDYIVTITNASGCSIKDTVKITVQECGCQDSCSWSKSGNDLVKTSQFIGTKNNADFKIRTNNTQRMVVAANGNVGIHTTAPTAAFHVNSTLVAGQSNPSNIRFENLQSGTGLNLVIDANGYVFKSNTTSAKAANDLTALTDELAKTKQELQELKQQVAQLSALMQPSSLGSAGNKALLIGCYPNPAGEQATIQYFLPEDAHSAVCNITNAEGRILRSFSLATGKGYGQLSIQPKTFGAGGTLFYSLIVNAITVDTKKVVIH